MAEPIEFHVQTSLNQVQQCTNNVEQCFVKMLLQESYHPGLAIPRWSVSVWTVYAQNDWFLYYSIVHPYYKGSTDETAVVYLKALLKSCNDIACSWYEPRWTMHRQVYQMYCHVYAMYIPCTDTYIHNWIHLFSISHVQTWICKNKHTCSCMCMFILVQRMYVSHICLLCTMSPIYEHEIKKLRFG